MQRRGMSEGLPWLVADIGGTQARFALVREAGGVPGDVVALSVHDFPSVEAAASHYLAARGKGGGALHPPRVALALASPISGDTVHMTNSNWVVSRTAVATALGAREVLLLNDFEALALALPRLAQQPQAMRWLGSARPDVRLPMAVVGPGTGLGVAGCVPGASNPAPSWIALAAEGGHATAAPADDFESDVLRLIRAEHGHVSAERVISGIGLPLLHRAVCTLRGTRCAPDMQPADITRRALDEGDADCLATLDTFCAMLGGFAGNVALTLGARGGVFIGGGIVPRLGAWFERSRFRERFEAKGRFEGYLSAIATGVIVADDPALAGAAQRLAQR